MHRLSVILLKEWRESLRNKMVLFGVIFLPIILVGGFRSKSIMEAALAGRNVDFVSICRPLINDPYLPTKMQAGEVEKSGCLSANNCWAEKPGAGISCKCPTIEEENE